MIKAVGRIGDKPLVILGLSRTNLERASAGDPIKVELSELGLPPTTVFIVSGDTEESIQRDLTVLFNEAPVIDKKTPHEGRHAT